MSYWMPNTAGVLPGGGGGALPYFAGSKGPSTALDNMGVVILTTPEVPTGKYLVTVNATYNFSAADTMNVSLVGSTGTFYGSPLAITHQAVGNFGETYMSSVTYVMTVTSAGQFELRGLQQNAVSDVTVLGDFISGGGACVTGYTMVQIAPYP